MKQFKKYNIVFSIYSFAFILAPIILLVVFSFTTITRMNTSDVSFTLDHLKTSLEPLYLKVIYMSLKLAFITTTLCLVIGYLCAYFITKIKAKYQTTVLIILILPMWMNMLLRTYAWKSILISNGILNQVLEVLGFDKIEILNTQSAVILGMVYNFLPFMIFPIYNSLNKMDKSLIEAAKDLGSTSFTVLRKVVFPLSLPGVISGVILVFMPSATSFVIPTYLGGGNQDLIGNIIERQFTVVGNWNLGSALSFIILTLMILTTLLLYKGEKKYEA